MAVKKMLPKLIVGDRHSGRTIELIKAAAKAESNGYTCYIVCHSREEARRIAERAETMGLRIGFPLTYDEFIHRSYAGNNVDRFYIDNLRMLLTHICPVNIDTVVW
jgi:hypothetical protein